MKKLAYAGAIALLIITIIVSIMAYLTGKISPWTGRMWSLIDPTYAKKYIPIIASVSEHQPTTWPSYFLDLHFLMIIFPAGFYFCLSEFSDSTLFLIIYGVTAGYFSGVMIRLMLVIAPIACILSGFTVGRTLEKYTGLTTIKITEENKKKSAN